MLFENQMKGIIMIKHLDDGYIKINCDRCNDEVSSDDVVYWRNSFWADYCKSCNDEYVSKVKKQTK